MVNACKVVVCILTTVLLNTCNAMDLNKEINQNDKIMQNNIEIIHNNNLNNNKINTQNNDPNKKVLHFGRAIVLLDGVNVKLFNNEKHYISKLRNININNIDDRKYLKQLNHVCIGDNCKLMNTKNPNKFKKLFNKDSANFVEF